MYELTHLQTKSATLKGLMGSSTTSKLINDALSSPMGSTSRKRASKIVSLMKRYRATDNLIMDGQGGPGYNTIEQQNPMAEASMGELVIFPSPPEMRIPMDGRGGPGVPGANQENWEGLKSLADFRYPDVLKSPQPGETNLGVIAGTIPRMVYSGTQGIVNTAGYAGYGVDAAQKGISGAISGARQWLNTPYDQAYQSNQPSVPGIPPVPGAILQQPTQPTSNIPWGSLSKGQVSSPQVPWGSLSMGQQVSNPQAPGAQTPQGGTQTQQPGPGTSAGTPGSTPGQTPTPGAYPAIQGAVDANQGPDAFALSMLGNPEALGGLPGFKDMPASARPTGVSLGNQIEQLSDTLKQELGLDSLLNQKDQMIKNGVTLVTDMSDYVRGRDQFLNQTQGMIDQYTDKMRTMDLANPNVAGRANQYMNYLYELRGRQNKRYIEFLNGSIGMYNAQLTDVSNNYAKALSTYESELTLKGNIKQTEYQMYYTALTGMYNAAQQAPLLAKQMELFEAQKLAALAAAAKDGGASVGNGYLTDANNIQSKAKGLVDEKTGFLLPTVNSLSGFINTVADGGKDSPSAYNAMQFAIGAMEGELKAAPDASTAENLSKKYLGWTTELYKGAANEQEVALVQKLRNNLAGSLASSITSTLTNDTNTLASIRGDMMGMLSPSLFNKGPSQKDFVTKYGKLIGDNVANSLWGGITEYKLNKGTLDLPPITKPHDLATLISDIAADGYTANIWNTALAKTQN